MTPQEVLSALMQKSNLSEAESENTLRLMLSEDISPTLVGSILVAWRMKGETVDEITGAAKAMRGLCKSIHPKATTVADIVGTGGDGTHSFNISTTSAFVVASAGVTVAKHGNRSVSSKSGASDVLKSSGLNLDITPEQTLKCIDEVGVAFLFAPTFHPLMRFVAPIRAELKVRTIFNILGPLLNPASANVILAGVFDKALVPLYAGTLERLNCKGYIVHGMDGMDEISLTGPSEVRTLGGDSVMVKPEDFGVSTCTAEDLKGGGPDENAAIMLSILDGTERGPKLDAVKINAGFCIAAAKSIPPAEGVAQATDSINSGKALEKFKALLEATRSF